MSLIHLKSEKHETVPVNAMRARVWPVVIDARPDFDFRQGLFTIDGIFEPPSELPCDFCVFSIGRKALSLQYADSRWALFVYGADYGRSIEDVDLQPNTPVHFEVSRGEDGIVVLINGKLLMRAPVHHSAVFGADAPIYIGTYNLDSDRIINLREFRVTRGVQRHSTFKHVLHDTVFTPSFT